MVSIAQLREWAKKHSNDATVNLKKIDFSLAFKWASKEMAGTQFVVMSYFDNLKDLMFKSEDAE